MPLVLNTNKEKIRNHGRSSIEGDNIHFLYL